jgi:hypothetical protein
MHIRIRFLGAIWACLALLAGITKSFAATFCIVGAAIPPQCLYESVSDCIKGADSVNTFCGINPETRLSYYGSERYCSVDSARVTQCLFSSREECNEAANKEKEICIDRNDDQTDNQTGAPNNNQNDKQNNKQNDQNGNQNDINPFKYDQRLLN